MSKENIVWQREIGGCVRSCLSRFPTGDAAVARAVDLSMMARAVVVALLSRYVLKSTLGQDLAMIAGIGSHRLGGPSEAELMRGIEHVLKLSRDEDGTFKPGMASSAVACWLVLGFKFERKGELS